VEHLPLNQRIAGSRRQAYIGSTRRASAATLLTAREAECTG
jgi:hypothetical protein